MADNERGIRRFVRLILDRQSAQRVQSDMTESLAKAGEDGGKAFLREIRSEFDQKMADLRHRLAKGLISQEDFRREADAAARVFNTKLSASIDNLRAKGKLTDREFTRLGRSFKNVGDTGAAAMGRMSSALYRVGFALGALFSVRSLFNFGRDSVRIAAEAEDSWNSLAGTLKTVGIEFADVRGEIEASANALKDTTRFGDEEFADTLQRLVVISGDYSRSLDNVGVVADVAAGAHLDLDAAAKLVGRAMVGDTGTLRRYGIVVREGEDAIAAMRRQFSGLAENEARTLAGQLDQMSNEWGDFREEIGGAIIDVGSGESALSILTQGLRDGTEWVRNHRVEFADWGRLVGNTLRSTGSVIGGTIEFFEKLERRVDRMIAKARFLPGSDEAKARLDAYYREVLRQEERDNLRATMGGGASTSGTVPPPGSTIPPPLQTLQQEISLLQRARELRTLEGNDIERIIQLYEATRSELDGGNLSLARRVELVQRLATLGTLQEGLVRQDPERVTPALQGTGRQPSMMPVSFIDMYGGAFLEDYANRWREQHAEMESVAVNAAHGIAGAWSDAFGLLFEDADNAGKAITQLGRQIGGALLGGLAQFASGKIAENIASAFEEIAKGTASAAAGNAPGAALHYKAAGEHGLAAIKWGIVGGIGSGAQSALTNSGGSGSRSGGLRSGAFDPAGRIADGLEQRGTETHIYIDPIDPNNPVHQREVGRLVRNAAARGHITVHSLR